MPRGSQLFGVSSGLADGVVHVINVIDDPQETRADRVLSKALVVVDESPRNVDRPDPEPAAGQRRTHTQE